MCLYCHLFIKIKSRNLTLHSRAIWHRTRQGCRRILFGQRFLHHNLVFTSDNYCGCKLPPVPAVTPLRVKFPLNFFILTLFLYNTYSGLWRFFHNTPPYTNEKMPRNRGSDAKKILQGAKRCIRSEASSEPFFALGSRWEWHFPLVLIRRLKSPLVSVILFVWWEHFLFQTVSSRSCSIVFFNMYVLTAKAIPVRQTADFSQVRSVSGTWRNF